MKKDRSEVGGGLRQKEISKNGANCKKQLCKTTARVERQVMLQDGNF
jgi:hypothetical protein